jgi:hypothetical protein
VRGVLDEQETAGGELTRFLAERDQPCPGCDYNLRGLQTSVCPECNQPLVLRLALAEPKLGRFLGAVVGLAVGTGFHGLLLVYFFWMLARQPYMRSSQSWLFLQATVPAFLVEGVLLWLLVRRRRRFQRAAAHNQGLTIAGAWLLTIVGFVLFCAFIR